VDDRREADGNGLSVPWPEGALGRAQLREPPAVGVEADRPQRRANIDASEDVERPEVVGKIG